jgi:hypothetical protein
MVRSEYRMETENRRLREERGWRPSGCVCLFGTARGTSQENAGAVARYRRGRFLGAIRQVRGSRWHTGLAVS